MTAPVKFEYKEILGEYGRFYYESIPHQRLGQYLMNTFLPSYSDPEIFYEEDDAIALDKFIDRYGFEE